MKFTHIYSIQAKFFIVFLLVVVIITCSGLLSIYVSKRHLSSTQLFVGKIFPLIKVTNDLQLAAFQVKDYSEELSKTGSRTHLNLVDADLTVVLTRMEKLTATLSQQESSLDVVSLNFLSQAIRSQSQLVFQLKAQLLEMESDQQMLSHGIRKALIELVTHEFIRNHYSGGDNHALVHDLLERLLLLTEKLNSPLITSLDVDHLKSEFTRVRKIFILQEGEQLEPKAAKESQLLMEGITEKMDQMITAKQKPMEIRREIDTFISTLKDLTDRLVLLTDQYIQKVSTGFQARTEQILERERQNINVTLGVLVFSIIILTLVYRQIVVRGFGNRLSMISRAMARPTRDDSPLPVTGRDEIADMAKAAEKLLRKAKMLNTQATIDELTQVYNRRHFVQLAKKEARIAARKKHPSIILMLDIDHFKRINDTWGHDFGDRVLFEFAKRCRRVSRAVDLFARYGGEEFVLLMPDTTPEQGMVAARRLLGAAASLEIYTDSGQRVTVTVSIGMVSINFDSEEIDPVIKKADIALYKAKSLGRNRVEVYNEALDR